MSDAPTTNADVEKQAQEVEPAVEEAPQQVVDISLEAPGRDLLAGVDGVDGVAKGSGWRLLLSHSFTKFGSKAWEFSTPLMLLYLTYPSLFAPAFYGMCIFLFKFLLGPYAGVLPPLPLPPLPSPPLLRRHFSTDAVSSCDQAPGSITLIACASSARASRSSVLASALLLSSSLHLWSATQTGSARPRQRRQRTAP